MRLELMRMILRALGDGPKGVRAIQRWVAEHEGRTMSFSTLKDYLRTMREKGLVVRYEDKCPLCGRRLPHPLWVLTAAGK